MGKFAKAFLRRKEKLAKQDVEKVEADYKHSKKAVQHATTKRIIQDHVVLAEAVDHLTLIFDVAVHEGFGWGKEKRARLHKKMARHILCLKSRLVTTKDIEKIVRDEGGVELEKTQQKEMWTRDSAIQHKAIDELSAIFLLSLMDEFGFKQKWLNRTYDLAAEVAHKLSMKENTIDDLKKSLEPRGKRVLLD